MPPSKTNYLYLVMAFIHIQNANPLPPTCPDVPKLHVNPGYGWDALQNKDSKQILQFTYNQCKITPDGKFIVPDDSTVTLIREDVVRGTIIENWANYTAPDAHGFQIITDVWPKKFLPLYFSFSEEYQEIKTLQLKHQAFTTRTQLRQLYYRLTVSRDVFVGDVLKNRFLEALNAIAAGRLDKAEYILQVVIRDYGTHYSKSIDIGTLFIKDDYLPNIFLRDHQKYKIIAAAKASFLHFISLSSPVKDKMDLALLHAYNNATLEIRVRKIGGPNWHSHINNDDLVAIDRSGDFISGLITESNFAGVPLETLTKCREITDKAIKDYYRNNVHEGCTDPKAENFDYLANVDNGTCQSQSLNFVFGGAYEVCADQVDFDFCSLFNTVNPLTSVSSCPTGFSSILLYERSCVPHLRIESRDYNRVIYKTVYGNINTYCCMASENSSTPSSMLIFGGLYSKQVVNIITKKSSCPVHFTELLLFNNNLTICVSTKTELLNHNSLRFGGLTTARMGLRCPDGYDGHLAVIFEGNEIHYCLQALKSVNYDKISLLIQPPFTNASSSIFRHKMFDEETEKILRKDYEEEDDAIKNSGTYTGVIIAACLVIGFLMFFGIGYWYTEKIKENFRKKWSDQPPFVEIVPESEENV